MSEEYQNGISFENWNGSVLGNIVKFPEKIKNLNSYLSEKSESPKITTVKGESGSGTSTLGKYFADENKENFAGIFWINCSSKQTLLEDYKKLYVEFTDDLSDKENSEIISEIKSWFAEHSKEKPWLIIYDNIYYPDQVEKWKEELFPEKNVNILLISSAQLNYSVHGLADQFNEGELFEFIDAHLSCPESDSELKREFGRHFDNLALILKIGLNYLKENEISLKEFNESYQKQRNELENKSFSVKYPGLNLIFLELKKENYQAFIWLILCGLFEGFEITGDFLEAFVGRNQMSDEWITEIKFVLGNLGLLEFRENDKILIHPLIKNIAKELLKADDSKFILQSFLSIYTNLKFNLKNLYFNNPNEIKKLMISNLCSILRNFQIFKRDSFSELFCEHFSKTLSHIEKCWLSQKEIDSFINVFGSEFSKNYLCQKYNQDKFEDQKAKDDFVNSIFDDIKTEKVEFLRELVFYKFILIDYDCNLFKINSSFLKYWDDKSRANFKKFFKTFYNKNLINSNPILLDSLGFLNIKLGEKAKGCKYFKRAFLLKQDNETDSQILEENANYYSQILLKNELQDECQFFSNWIEENKTNYL